MEVASIAGLSLILLSWVFQLFSLSKGRKEIRREFLSVYFVGSLVLALDGYQRGMLYLAVLNLMCCVVVAFSMIKAK